MQDTVTDRRVIIRSFPRRNEGGPLFAMKMLISVCFLVFGGAGAFAPPSSFVLHPAKTATTTSLRDAEDLVEQLDAADCTVAKSSIASLNKDDDEVMENGTAKRVQQNPLGKFADFCSATTFSLLHFNDDLEIKDSSKNLRVLWSRAYLDHVGAMKDDIAYTLLPTSTRDAIKLLPKSGPLVNFQEFITSRTNFIDSTVDKFLDGVVDSHGSGVKPQIVLFGAGYDTRSLRYNRKADFFEVDLPDVVDGKGRLQEYWKNNQNNSEEIDLPTRIGYNLNDAMDEDKPNLSYVLKDAGLNPDVPTLFVWEAVLFYVKPEAVMELFSDIFNLGDNSVYCLVDSLKPAVTTSFLHEVRSFMDDYQLEVIDHNSRWGGAVHFVAASRKDSDLTAALSKKSEELPFSYLATSVEEGIQSQKFDSASFNDHWYAVAYPWQVKEGEVFATRLWGEPLVLYRDSDGNLVCSKDVCPHRSAPLSMGKINDEGQLECMYHGWGFGKDGNIESIPTQIRDGGSSKRSPPKRSCLKTYCVEEHEGLIWIWRGELLEADASKLPKTRDVSTYPIDTVLDYNVDWQYIVENNLDSPHLFWLHNGSVPPVRSLNFVREKVNQVKLQYFRDDSGHGHYGQTAGGKPKIVRFDSPNIVRHGGTSSFSEEFHIVPIAPGRTRVLLRQNLPKGPILTTALSIPGADFVLEKLVNLWNYHIALEDYSVMQGQAHNVDDLGANHLSVGDLGDDLIKHFYKWKEHAVANDGALPFFSKWDSSFKFGGAQQMNDVVQESSYSVVDDQSTVNGENVGTYGILKSYTQQTPIVSYPPNNYKMYKPLLDLDQAFRKDAPGNEEKEENGPGLVFGVGFAAACGGAGVATARAAEALDINLLDLPHNLIAFIN